MVGQLEPYPLLLVPDVHAVQPFVPPELVPPYPAAHTLDWLCAVATVCVPPATMVHPFSMTDHLVHTSQPAIVIEYILQAI